MVELIAAVRIKIKIPAIENPCKPEGRFFIDSPLIFISRSFLQVLDQSDPDVPMCIGIAQDVSKGKAF